ncbi:MAG: hypothetical protein HOP07_04440 [Bacteriovoracaceae bacterium]|nr:hypothetical protein [Bacteriovoracaceae bacterium]
MFGKFNFFKNLLALVLLTGCVGTIQDVSKLQTDSSIAQKGKLSFLGIEKATATAHNRVRVSFSPASGGTGQFSYLVYANGNFALPVSSVSSSSVGLDSLGKINVDVKNLQLNTAYNFSVRVYDVGNDESDSNTVSFSVRTLSEMVPLFDGAVALNNLAGVDGLSKLVLSWNVATAAYVDTSGFGNSTHNISGYNIYAGEGEASLTLVGSLNDPAAKSFTIPNLLSGRTYYAMVRARNSAVPPVEDFNSTIFSKKTLIAQPILFAGIKTISIPKTVEGFSSINLTWDAGIGTFDRYKILVFESNPGVVNPVTASPSQTIVINDLTVTSQTITVPTPNSTYYIAVVACAGDACLEFGGASVVKSIKTTPPVAPFNGIKSVIALGLNSVQLNFDKPDTTQGVYSKIKLFKSNNLGNYNELIDEITTEANATGLLISTNTETSITVQNMVTNTEYCFVAMDYDTFYLSTEYPNGRTNLLRVKACITLQYISPGFLGINSSCTAPNSSGFTVSWLKPIPLGIFDSYEMYVKEGNSGFNFADAIAGNPGYQKLPPLNKDLTSYTFNSVSAIQMAADTYYQVGVKTYYNDSGTFRRDTNNSFTINCKTSAASVDHKGWYEILALGPKVNGLKAAKTSGVVTQDEVIAERIKPRGTPVNGFNELRDFEYAEEWPMGSLGLDSSKQGIVKLMWNDFELSNGLGKLFDYAAARPTAVVEYKVYRKAHASKYDTAYKIKAKVSDTDWGAPINVDVISPQMTTLPTGESLYFATFTDYTLVHPYVADPTKINEGAIFYYKVEAFINGNKVGFLGTYADSIVRVVLPPANMTFAHRWMLNQQMCGELNKKISNGEVDRENDYKCLYNGLASTFDSLSNSYYYDMKGDLLVDRFRMGCNFSRGGTAKSCSNVNYTVPASKVFFEGATNDPAKDRIVGDCVGYGGSTGTSPNAKILAIPGAVFIDRSSQSCYINTTSAGLLDGNGKGTTWQRLAEIDPSNDTLKTASKILPLGLSTVGLDVGSKIYTTNAYMPPLNGANQNNFYRTCQSTIVPINGIDHRKRLIRRKEQIATFAMSNFITSNTNAKINSGSLMSGAIDKDCFSDNKASTMIPFSPTAAGADELDLTKWNYITAYNTSYMQVVVTGSSGDKSTETCFSKFGLQDIAGNKNEILADRLKCNGDTTKDLCSSGIKDKGAITEPPTPDSSLLVSQTYTPEIDPANKYNLKSANGHYLNFTASSISEGNGVNLLTASSINNYAVVSTPANYKYFNPILGVMLSCSGSSCLIGGGYDDNTLVTTKSSSTVAQILSFKYIGTTWTTDNTTPTVIPFMLNGFSTDSTTTGRHSMGIRGFFNGNSVGSTVGRCATLIEDYNDQGTQYND